MFYQDAADVDTSVTGEFRLGPGRADWTSGGQHLTNPRFDIAYTQLGNDLYIIGGWDDNGPVIRVDVYDMMNRPTPDPRVSQ